MGSNGLQRVMGAKAIPGVHGLPAGTTPSRTLAERWVPAQVAHAGQRDEVSQLNPLPHPLKEHHAFPQPHPLLLIAFTSLLGSHLHI